MLMIEKYIGNCYECFYNSYLIIGINWKIYLIDVVFVFSIFMECMIFWYIIVSFMFRKSECTKKMAEMLAPVFMPIRKLLKYSIIGTFFIDFSPIVVLILIAFVQQLLYPYI